ncbi:MAG: glutamine--tRNA ligase/YqeY domain fusion protein [Magnetococcales bacterium]|nr:glutamine--tRNA ligase/YqeY domain fusion protein [Magnetococcales bacterium]
MTENEPSKPIDFIRTIVAQDLAAGKWDGKVTTRFPPEPNGYLHIGHAKSICLNFGIALENPTGVCHLRFDDTNPEKEEEEYIQAILEDVKWLGFDWKEKLFYASNYFDKLYELAEVLIQQGDAYVCGLSAEEVRTYRGTLTEPGKNSPSRDQSPQVNLDLFRRMRAGEFPDGRYILRAKIDMASPNINMRDPALYRIRRATHHQTGDKWCIYPIYDFTHGISDALEGITHSLCTLEFEDHRPLYDWILDRLESQLKHHPQQIEFSRLALDYTVVSKRKLITLVNNQTVSGWDDPRMPTLSGLRRRGYTPESIRHFCSRIGITKSPNNVEISFLEGCLREDLEKKAKRAMAILNPLKVVIENYPEDQVEEITAPNHPQDPDQGERTLFMSREIYIDREDFMEVAPNKKFKRLVLGQEVRLRNSYVIRCEEVIRDPHSAEITQLRCRYDETTLNANPEGRKVKGVIHWVSASKGHKAEIRLYDRLFTKANPDEVDEGGDFTDNLNPDSLKVLKGCPIEPSLSQAKPGETFQFERVGYFCKDPDSTEENPIFNRAVTLRDSWAKISSQGGRRR